MIEDPKKRLPLSDDQTNTENALNLIIELMELNKQIETTLWYGAFASAIFLGFKQSGFNRKQYIEQMHEIIKIYEKQFEE